MAVTNIGKKKWRARLQFPTTRIGKTGKTIYKSSEETFETKGAAEAWEKIQRQQHKATGTDATLTTSEVAEYREAKKIARGGNLRDVARFWEARNPEAEQATVFEVVTAYQDSPEWENYAASTKSSKRSSLKQFAGRFGDLAIGSVTLKVVENHLNEIPCVVTRNSQIRTIKTFFKWATNRKHRFLNYNPVHLLEQEAEDMGTPEYLTVLQVEALFDQAIKTDTAMIPFLAISFFAGIRSSEIIRMEEKDFHIQDRKINIRKEVAKRKRKGKPLPRFIEGLPDTLWDWLDAVDFKGDCDTINYNVRRRAIYEAAGIEKWPNSAARHTFATHAYAHFQESGKVKKWTGHRGDDTVFLSHYAGLETQENGTKYFGILPPSEIAPVRKLHINANRADWPSDQLLLKRLKEGEPKTKIAAELGVSEAAVRKHLKRRGLS